MKRSIARGRVFPQSYSTDRRYGRLSLKAIGLFPLMWANADDQGRLCGDPEEVKYTCCPNIDHITKADIPGLLKELERNQLIKVYETPKSEAIQLLDWWEVQHPQWAWPSEYPALDGWRDRLRYKKNAKEIATLNWPGGAVSDLSGEDQNHPQASRESASFENRGASQVKAHSVSGEDTKGAHVSEDKVLALVTGSLENETEKEKETESENERRKRNSPETPKGSQVNENSVSGGNVKGSQVKGESFEVAQKSPDLMTGERRRIFEVLKEKRGYISPQPGAEAQAITWMLKHEYTVEQILFAYDILKRDKFWRDKLLSMQSVKAQIGEIVKGGDYGKRTGDSCPQDPGNTGRRAAAAGPNFKQPVNAGGWQVIESVPGQTG